ncbi:MAG: transposase [Oscillospiraceae bacterium]|nr:transposase [Oscillospiraceae bacterium]
MAMWYGGQNKTHDSVAHYDRLDSFQIGALRGLYAAFWDSGGSIVLDCLEDSVGLSYSTNGPPERVKLSRVANRYGGDRAYFLCPDCGRRVRFLYRLQGRGLFRCRSCYQLNYPSQQERPNETGAYLRGVKLLRERFKLSPMQIPAPRAFYEFVPPRPKGMHRRTYRELYRELELIQGEYYRCYYIRTHKVGRRVNWSETE